MSALLDTEALSDRYRRESLDAVNKRFLITKFGNTKQELDLTEPPNCEGLGRVRHFRRCASDNWPLNPLPIDPASKALGIPPGQMIRAQVFQTAACNWRCWYCFVDFKLLSANPNHSTWMTADGLLDLYLSESNRPPMIDLTGGQPDLVPELVPWMMKALANRRLDKTVYLWSDDNLSNDFFWRYLSDDDRATIRSYRNYGRVCCFKGFDQESFSFNTKADTSYFRKQFDHFTKLFAVGFDIYAYATFTAPRKDSIADAMPRFVDCLQSIHPNAPLRTVPLEIQLFTPVVGRMNATTREALKNQYYAVEAWQNELGKRFSSSLRALSIASVPFGGNIK
jgi:uncharacterized Fe-S cluster-containing radical SAM superfamily protein